MLRPDLLSIFTESIYAAAWDSLSNVQPISFNFVIINNIVARKMYNIKGDWQLFVHYNIYAPFSTVPTIYILRY